MKTLQLNVFATIFILIATVWAANFHYEITYKTDALRLGEQEIKNIVHNAFDLDNFSHPLARIEVNVYQKYLHVILYRGDIYLAKSYRLNLENNRLVTIQGDGNYIEESENTDYCGTCPDPEIGAMFSSMETTISTAVQCIEKAGKTAEAAGLKAVVLKGKDENLKNILNYLSCPKLRIFMRVGHGYSGGYIGISGGQFATSNITQNAAIMKDKIFHFNSCEVHGTTMKNAFIQTAKAYWFSGGTGTVPIGSSERATNAFLDLIITQKKEMGQSFKDSKCNTAVMGYTGNPSIQGGYFFFSTSTSLFPNSTAASTIEINPVISVYQNKVFLLGIPSLTSYSIYDLSGQLIAQNSLSNVWDMNTLSGQKVRPGNYIAVINNKNSQVEKTFAIIK